MRPKPDTFLEKHRIRSGPLASDPSFGNNGAFLVRCPKTGRALRILVSDGMGWEHVSISPHDGGHTPIWDEMCWVKDLFWGPEESVVQYHPPASEYRNLAKNCLHLWRPIGCEIPRPDGLLVAPKGSAELMQLPDWKRQLIENLPKEEP